MAARGDSPSAPELSVLVVSWRTRDALAAMLAATTAALDELARRDGLTAEVIVVDNASGDGTVEMVTEQYGHDRRVTLIDSPTNTGFAGGNNLALDHARGRLLAVVNPDVELDVDALAALLTHLRVHPEAGLVTATLVGHDGRAQRLHRALPTLPTIAADATRTGRRVDHRLLGGRLRRAYRLADLPATGVARIGQAAGALIVLRADDLPRLGGYLFDESLPILVNDVDLSRRVHDAGLEVHLLVDVRVRHEGGAGLRQVDPDTLAVAYWDGMAAYARRHSPRWHRTVLAVLEPPAVRRARRRRPVPDPEATPLGDDAWVTVVVISHQYGHLLPTALDSALAQTWPHTEVLVVDDGSTDDTAAVARRYAHRGVQYVGKPNGGLSQARNVGAARARGAAVVFLDADDTIRPDMVSRTMAALQAHPDAALAYVGAVLRHDDPSVPDQVVAAEPWEVERLVAGNHIFATNLARTEVIRRFPYDESNRIGWEDWDLLLTLAEHGLHGTPVDAPLLVYRQHPSSMTAAMAGVVTLDQRRRVLRRHRRLVGGRRWLRAEWRGLRIRTGLARRRLLGR